MALGPMPGRAAAQQLAAIITIPSTPYLRSWEPTRTAAALLAPCSTETGGVSMASLMQTSKSELHVILEAKLQILDKKQAEPTPPRKNSREWETNNRSKKLEGQG